jgi:predicted DNA-binding transcriptional regulator YafY
MYNPTLRLLTVLELLQSRAEVSGLELAQTLEVDARSIRRYIMMLRDMGIPVEGERGRHGGYSLRPGFKLPPLMFNTDEITAVKMSLMLMREVGAAPAQAVESASAKIERVLTDELREIANALQYAIKLDEIRPGTRAVTSQLIVVLSRAVHEGSTIDIVYQSGDSETSNRAIDPYGLVLHAHAWYVPAYCHSRHEMRVFRLDRIKSAAFNGRFFTKPVGFDAKAFVLESLARVFGGIPLEVLLHIPLATAQELISPAIALLQPAGKETLMQCYTDDVDWFARYLVSSHVPFTVIENDDLRAGIKALAHELLAAVT